MVSNSIPTQSPEEGERKCLRQNMNHDTSQDPAVINELLVVTGLLQCGDQMVSPMSTKFRHGIERVTSFGYEVASVQAPKTS